MDKKKLVDDYVYKAWADRLDSKERSIIFEVEAQRSHVTAFWTRSMAIIIAIAIPVSAIMVKFFADMDSDGAMIRFALSELVLIIATVAFAWNSLFHSKRRWYFGNIAKEIRDRNSREDHTMPSRWFSNRRLGMYQNAMEKQKTLFREAVDDIRRAANKADGLPEIKDDPEVIKYSKLIQIFRYELEKRTMINLSEEKLSKILETFTDVLVETAIANRPKEYTGKLIINTPMFALRVRKVPANGPHPECYGVAFGEPRRFMEELNKDIIQKETSEKFE